MKDYRSNEMKNLALMLCFLFLIWCTPVLESIAVAEGQSPYTALSVTLGSGLVAIILSSATLLLDCLIGSKLKDKLVGLFFIPRSGETIFTRISKGKLSDDRFQLSEATALYAAVISDLPSEKEERKKYENGTWYGIYYRYQEKGQVEQTQRDYLMCRDLFTETLAFVLLYVVSLIVFPNIVVFSKKFLTLLLVLATTLNLCTHLKMNRFTNTVLAVDIANHKEEQKTTDQIRKET